VKTLLRGDTSAAVPGEPVSFREVEEASRGWNLWELEQVARTSAALDPAREEERALLLLTLRQFAASSGELPREFDPLVRDLFGTAIVDASPQKPG
jgi:hypothetical protein